jgi:hypothetical protein
MRWDEEEDEDGSNEWKARSGCALRESQRGVSAARRRRQRLGRQAGVLPALFFFPLFFSPFPFSEPGGRGGGVPTTRALSSVGRPVMVEHSGRSDQHNACVSGPPS